MSEIGDKSPFSSTLIQYQACKFDSQILRILILYLILLFKMNIFLPVFNCWQEVYNSSFSFNLQIIQCCIIMCDTAFTWTKDDPPLECPIFKKIFLLNVLASCVTVRQHSTFQMVNYEKIFASHKCKYGSSVTCQFCMHVAPHTTTGQRN